MRIRLLSLVTTGALVVGLAASAGASANRGVSAVARGKAAAAPAAPSALTLLYDQNNSDAGVGIISQDFTDSGFDIYDSQGADDFTIPAGTDWKVQAVVVTGVYFNGPGPADSQTVTLYRDAGGLPGAPIRVMAGLHGLDTGGSFRIKLPGTGIGLHAGTYWVSVQVTMAFTPGGEWGWETRTLQGGNAAAWQNPGDGFGTGCTSYANMQTCIGPLGEGPDYMFALYGKKRP